ncbi:MAG: SCO family protein [Acidimicrobiales bacterium]
MQATTGPSPQVPAPGVPSRLWRWLSFGVLPFLLSLSLAMAITAYVDRQAQSQPSTSLRQLMSLSKVPATVAPPFTLTDQRGRRVALSAFKGKVVLLAFIDAKCTLVCPVIAQMILQAQKDLGARAANVAYVAVNVNPLAESVADVASFTKIHGLAKLTNWYFLTGSTPQLERIWREYGIYVNLPKGATQVVHQDFLFFLNQFGRERFMATPFALQRKNGTGFLPSDTLQRWGQGIAKYLERSSVG